MKMKIKSTSKPLKWLLSFYEQKMDTLVKPKKEIVVGKFYCPILKNGCGKTFFEDVNEKEHICPYCCNSAVFKW